MSDVIASALQTMLRFFPFPTRTGLRVVGSPGRDAPVLATCNFDLTVRRVTRALRGLDCYLLVAPSKGINVWCAAAGSILNAHAIISVLKTSQVADRVSHRMLILPQLAAPGVDVDYIRETTGWTCKFGPVYAKDLAEYLATGCAKTPEMRLARFPIRARLEMAIMWAFPLSVLAGIPVGLADLSLLPGVLAVIWGLALLTYVLYEPLMERVPGSSGNVKALVVGLAVTALVVAYGVTVGRWRATGVVGWSLAVLGVAVILGFDLDGTSPLRAGSSVAYWGRRWPVTLKLWAVLGFHMESFFELAVSQELCVGCGTCVNVCPTGALELYASNGRVMSRVTAAERCEQCTACIKQCPEGAIVADPPIRGFDTSQAAGRADPDAGQPARGG